MVCEAASARSQLPRRVAVIGAGITGLAAAFELRCLGGDVVVLESSDRCGGKVAAARFGQGDHCGNGGPVTSVDSGPDGFIARDPAAADLCRRVGLGSDVVEAQSRGALLWIGDALVPFPERTVLGVPYDPGSPADPQTLAASGIVSSDGLGALRRGLAWDAPGLAGDASIGEVLRPRLGDEVFERLVDPLLGGINAGSPDEMSIKACAPALYQAAKVPGPFAQSLRKIASGSTPTFESVDGGVTRLVDALESVLGAAIHLDTPVTRLKRGPDRPGQAPSWEVVTPQGSLTVDGVIVAAPAWQAARLLDEHTPEASVILWDIEYADVVLMIVVASGEALGPTLLTHAGTSEPSPATRHAASRCRRARSGFLVPRTEGLLMTACSWSSAKWRHYQCDRYVLRVSAGRTDDTRWQDMQATELKATLIEELITTGVLRHVCQTRQDDLLECKVVEWRRSLPQYRPGHLERVAHLEECLRSQTPGVVVTGAAMRSLGLPACIRQGQNAAHALMDTHA